MPPKSFNNNNNKSRSRGGPHAAGKPTGASDAPSNARPKRPVAAKIKAGTSMRKSVTQLRSEIRGLERLLNKKRDTLNAQARSDMERKLAALKFQLDRTQTLQRDAAKVEKFEAMYRAVKFVERVKATRTVRKLQRKLEAGEEVQQKLNDAMLDVCYVMHFPPATKYYALYKTPEGKEAEMARDEIRDQIRSLVESGAIDKEATVARCLGLDEDGTREKKKTKRKGLTEEEVRHKALGNMLRGVKVEKKGAAGVDETIESEAKPINDDFFMADDSSDDDDESDGEEEAVPAARGKKKAAAASSASSSDTSSSDGSDSDDDMSE
ncbi:hypothetical protein AMAG_08299 [Allomyces macrogynus ATCC 38327]|uniref:rRNA-processing protein EFG1 n=1 Tax=Allomyces macrogynus (strain ATCC 38327) TaxID=578462 RepID=A0A0L0SKT2_ALLM3|nr:hypothetical protein AMAG_08299 [Allomyces macrogynus ATCC 38327]|eukprot:KNE63137.1 hypothetical protein AMAG_08299 [Allomyces macrogynus ATCC 38327]